MSFLSCGVWQWHNKNLTGGGGLLGPPSPGIGLNASTFKVTCVWEKAENGKQHAAVQGQAAKQTAVLSVKSVLVV